MDALIHRQATHGQWIVVPDDGEISFTPSQSLRLIGCHLRSRLSRNQTFMHKDRFPAPGMHSEAGMHVFGNCLRGDQTHVFQSLATHDRCTATEHHRIGI